MRKYQLKCQEKGCGKVLGVLELPDKTPLKDQVSGYLWGDCGKNLAANIRSSEAPPSGVTPEQAVQLKAFKEKLAAQKTGSSANLDEVTAILFRTEGMFVR